MNTYTLRELIFDWVPWHWLKHRCPAGHTTKLPPSPTFIDRWNARHARCKAAYGYRWVDHR